MRERRRVLVGLALALVLTATACSDDDADTTSTQVTTTMATTTTEPTTTTRLATTTSIAEIPPIVVWGDQQREQVITAAAEDFTADTGIPVVLELKDRDSIRADIQTAAPRGDGPDLFIGSHEWLGEIVANGIVAPIDLGPTADEFFGIARDAFTFDGQLFGVPFALETAVLFRNTGLVAEAPSAFGDLLSACDAIVDQIQNCLGIPAGDAYANQAFLGAFGGYIFGFDDGFQAGDLGLNSEGALAGAAWLDEQVKAGVLDPAIGWEESRSLFSQGQQAFMWDLPSQMTQIPEDVAYDISPFPSIEGNSPLPLVGVQGYFLSAYSEQPVAALLFLIDYLAAEEAQFRLFEESGRPPAHVAAYQRAVEADPQVGAIGDVASSAPPTALTPNIPEMSAVWGPLGEAISDIYGQAYDDELPDAAAIMERAATQAREAIAAAGV